MTTPTTPTTSPAPDAPQAPSAPHEPHENASWLLDGPFAAHAPSYWGDGLAVWGRQAAFMRDPGFMDAYRKGMDTGHKIGRPAGSREDIHIEWRMSVIAWAARHAARLPGDFVECGVNTGIFSVIACESARFNELDKDFYLFDTFRGIPEAQMSDGERPARLHENEAFYEECYELASQNFAPYPRARLVRGPVPDTLGEVQIDRVAYLSIDMNIAAPERAALEHFWPRLVPGAPVIFDDYGWLSYAEQKDAHDEFAAAHGVPILELPTGQGLLIKPPA